MLGASLIALIMSALHEAPELFRDGANLFNTVAHGEGGAAKVKAVASGLQTLADHAANAVATVEAEQIAASGGGAGSNGGTGVGGPLSDAEKEQLAALQARAAANAS